MRLESYDTAHATVWDQFVRQSKNGTFLFLRDYMEYHGDRFEDASLLIWDNDDVLVALLPANRVGSLIQSHAGLTYGGFIVDSTMKLPRMLEVFEATLNRFQAAGIEAFHYKTIPFPYHRVPAGEDRCALFLCNARLLRCGVLAITDRRFAVDFQERRKRGVKKASKLGLRVSQSEDWTSYWTVLADRLSQNYAARPVHTLPEIRLLAAKFPENIKLFGAFEGAVMVAGVVIHETDRVARAQYIAASDRGQQAGAVDLIFQELLTKQYADKPYFDFGTSDDQNGRRVNRGLIDQKEGYGARVVPHEHYEIILADWRPGQLIGALQ